jgi:pimeloyl-ACP methyl ester carboxylesterase
MTTTRPGRASAHPLCRPTTLLLLAALLAGSLTLGTPVARAANPGSGDRATPALDALAGDPSAPGPWAVGEREVTVESGDRSFPAWVAYPAAGTGGPDAPIAAGRFPGVVFGHGYLAPVELYASTLAHLASWGFVVVAPRSGGELFPSHAAFGADLAGAARWLVAQDAVRSSWLSGAVEPAVAVSGHSMGGGAALLAAADEPAITSVAVLAAAETDPSAIGAAGRIAVPALIVAGDRDAITPMSVHQAPMFEALTRAPAQLRTIIGGSHCGFTDPDAGLASALAGLACDTASIDRPVQLALTRGLLTDWLRLTLDGEGSLEARVWTEDAAGATTLRMSRP